MQTKYKMNYELQRQELQETRLSDPKLKLLLRKLKLLLLQKIRLLHRLHY